MVRSVEVSPAHPFGFNEGELTALSIEIWESYAANITRYATLASTGIRDEVVQASREVIDVYLTALDTKILPAQATSQELTKVERRRLSQGFRPEELQRATILQSEIIWNHVSRRAPRDDLPELASLTLRIVDLLAGSRAQAQRQLSLARSASVRSHVSQLLLDEIESGTHDVTMAVEAAKSIGYDIARPGVGVVIASYPTRKARLTADEVRSFYHAIDLLQSGGTPLLGAAADGGYRVVIAGASRDLINAAIAHILEHTVGLEALTRTGVGSALPGPAGIQRSLRQANRARSIGIILEPSQPVSYFEDVDQLDIFKDDEQAIASFVRKVLSPLLQADAETGGSLVETIEMMFDCGWSRKVAAARLHLHPNTVDYRIRQAERLMGVTFDQGRSMFKILLALQLLGHVQQTSQL
jgi:sugar diacid utilization regulator